MIQQRSVFVHHARSQCTHLIFEDRARYMSTASERFTHHAAAIGYQPTGDAGPHYSAWNAPIIHGDESAVWNEETVFLHPAAMRVRPVYHLSIPALTRAHTDLYREHPWTNRLA